MALQGRFGVEVSTRFTPAGWVAPDLPPAAAPPRLTETAVAFGLSGAALDAEIVSVRAKRSELAAYEAGLVERKAALGARHPLPLLPGARDEAGGAVDDFLPDEVAVLLRCSVTSARHLVEHALVLVRQLPAVWHALADGRIDESRARVVCEVLRWQATSFGGPHSDDHIDAVAARAVGWAERGCPPTTLRERLQAELVALDPEAAEARREQRERAADVTTTPTGDGTAELRATGVGADRAALMRAQLTAYARKLKADGDPRPLGALRNAVMDALILRPWESPDPAVAHVTITAELRDLIDPDQLATLRDLMTEPADDPADAAAAADRATQKPPTQDIPAPDTTAQTHLPRTRLPTHLTRTRLARHDCPTRQPHRVPNPPAGARTGPERWGPAGGGRRGDADHPGCGAAAAATHRRPRPRRPHERRPRADPHRPWPHAGRRLAGRPARRRPHRHRPRPPPATTAYTPTAAQYRYLRARDRHCRFPGCRRTALACDADHVVPHDHDNPSAGGPTCVTNLALLCRHHHRLKTHHPGWAFRLDPDGTLHVTTPGGTTLASRPPGIDHVLDLLDPAPPPHDPVADPPPF